MKKGRRSIRLRDFDYSQPGAYFVTICALDRECLFGDVVGGKVTLNELGIIVAETWQWLERQYEYVVLDEWVVMPNHLHGVIVITDCRGGSRTAPTGTAVCEPPLRVWVNQNAIRWGVRYIREFVQHPQCVAAGWMWGGSAIIAFCCIIQVGKVRIPFFTQSNQWVVQGGR